MIKAIKMFIVPTVLGVTVTSSAFAAAMVQSITLPHHATER